MLFADQQRSRLPLYGKLCIRYRPLYKTIATLVWSYITGLFHNNGTVDADVNGLINFVIDLLS